MNHDRQGGVARARGWFGERLKMNRMIKAMLAALGLAVVLAQPAPTAQSTLAKKKPCMDFSELKMTLERNDTDGDTEVVLLALGQDEGLQRLEITAPNGRRVAKFDGDGRGIGIREFLLESAEPPDLDAVLASFPEGIYSFNGKTVTGDCLEGTAPLSHEIVPPTELVSPKEEQEVPIDKLVLRWKAVPGVERYVVELNKETPLPESEMTFDVLPPDPPRKFVSVRIPAHFVQPENTSSRWALRLRMVTSHSWS